MSKSGRDTATRDRGAVLPLALVFVIALSLIVGALATYAAVSIRSSSVTDQTVNRLTAAESGMQYALAAAAGAPTSCVGSPVPRGTINEATVTTTCWRVAELENLDTLYALVLTGEGPGGPVTQLALDVNGANSDNGVKDISGPVYFGAPGQYLNLSLVNARAVLPDPSNPANVLGGVVRYEPVTSSCPDPAAPISAFESWTGTPLRTPTVTCEEREWEEISPAFDFSDASLLAVNTLSPTAAAPTTMGLCDVYEPGLYPAPPNITGPSYFRSGVYYFATGEVRIDDLVVVGKRIGTDYPDATDAGLSAECAPIWEQPAEDDSGAVWFMGADARVFTDSNSQLDFYGRDITDTADPPRTVARSVVGLTSGQSTAATTAGLDIAPVTLPVNGSVSPAPPKIIDRSNGGNASMSFYGQVYAPNSWVDTGNAASAVFVEFLSGIVAGRLSLKAAANVDGFNISVPTTVVNAFYIESSANTVASPGTGSTTVRTRSVEVVGPPRTLNVDSWRVCERGTC